MLRVHQFYIFPLISLNTTLNVRSTAMFYSLSMLRKLNCKKTQVVRYSGKRTNEEYSSSFRRPLPWLLGLGGPGNPEQMDLPQ